MATPLGKPSDKADRPDKPSSLRVAVTCGVCVVVLLGFVVLATTFVARLATIRILPATRFTKDLIRGSLMQHARNAQREFWNRRIKAHAIFGDHLIAPAHRSHLGGNGGAAGVFKTFVGF